MKRACILCASFLALASLFFGCAFRCGTTCARPQTEGDRDLSLLSMWLTGDFWSGEQAEDDPAYFDVRLHMARIWPKRTDGYWLYVEQAMATGEDKPYRQRVYRVHRVAADTLASAVHTLPDEARFVGAWRSPRALDGLAPDSLDLREGCTIYITRADEKTFRGETRGKGCASTLKGASYGTSEVVIRADEVVSWDRGFDAEGNQVWGATKGGYVFRRGIAVVPIREEP
jgi:hypothetical protein